MLFLTCFKVTALVNAQQINITLKEVTLETVFNEIKKQTGYGFWYDKQDLETAGKVSVSIKNGNIRKALDQCLKDLPFTYEIFDKTIAIKRKAKTNSGQEKNKSVSFTVIGRVTDEQGSPIAGVTVRLKNTDRITLTNANGEFSIEAPDDGNSELQFSYLGYSPVEKAVIRDRLLNVTLVEETNTLRGVEINAGYYTIRDKERTGSISKITAETIEKQPINNPLQALQGRIAGVQITQTTGVPGGAFSVQIRGRNSLNPQVANDPLYIIDGVIYPSMKISSSTSNLVTGGGVNPLSIINPNDILSMEVLKDADATAIYGSRGANGVILISTKKGNSGDIKVTSTFYQGFSQVAHKMDLMNTEQYLQMRNEAFKNDGLSPTNLDYDVNGVWDQSSYTDWQDELIGGKAGLTNANVNISGGTSFSNFFIGGNYYHEGTVFPGNFGLKRGGLHSSLTLGAEKSRLKTTFTLNYTNTKSNLLTSDLTNFIILAPNYPSLYNQEGNLNWTYKNTPMTINPMATLLNTIDSSTDNLIGNVDVSYRLWENLFFKTSLGYTNIKREELTKRPLRALSPANNPTNLNRQSYFGNNTNTSWIAEPQINYATALGNGKLEALIGLTFQGNEAKFQNILANGFNSDDLMDNIGNASTLTKYENTDLQYRYNAIFVRANYNLADKYIFNLTGRRDGSSRFGPGKQLANFGAIGSAWIFSEEVFIKKALPFLSFGKIRASYGVTGNDQIPDYGYLQLWTNSGAGTYQGTSALTINRLSNSNYGWEITKKFEGALQLGFLKDKINLEISYYQNRSSNQLLLNPTPPSVGSTGILVNLPATVQNNGFELEASVNLIQKVNLSWSTNFNLTIPKNKLVSYPNLAISTNRTTYIIGKPLSTKQIYNVSVDPITGYYVFEDKDRSGTQNDSDRYLSKFLGQKFYGGIQNSIRYKRISLDFLISFSKQTGNNYMSSLTYNPGYFASTGGVTNQPTEVMKRWQKNQDQSSIQKFTTTTTGFINYLTAKTDGGLSITDASFIRLKNVSLIYQLPHNWLSKIKISDAKLSLQGQNIYTWTNYVGLDPESQSVVNLPPLRALTVGLNLTF